MVEEMGTTRRANAWMAGLQDSASQDGNLVWWIDGYLLVLGMGGRNRTLVARAYCGFIATILAIKIFANVTYMATHPLNPAYGSLLLSLTIWNIIGLEVGARVEERTHKESAGL
jgi:hypothetical protein